MFNRSLFLSVSILEEFVEKDYVDEVAHRFRALDVRRVKHNYGPLQGHTN